MAFFESDRMPGSIRSELSQAFIAQSFAHLDSAQFQALGRSRKTKMARGRRTIGGLKRDPRAAKRPNHLNGRENNGPATRASTTYHS